MCIRNRAKKSVRTASTFILVAILSACGGGGSSSTPPVAATPATPVVSPVPAIPASPVVPDRPVAPISNEPLIEPLVTGNVAVDGANWIIYRRQQAGARRPAPNDRLQTAAQGHSQYQALNGAIGHGQIVGQPGFTGASGGDRITATGYKYVMATEVITTTSGVISGQASAESFLSAIYHRFGLLSPQFGDIGIGYAQIGTGNYYFTAVLASQVNLAGVGTGNFIVYPASNQTKVPPDFVSDAEIPDPLPEANIVGYPISIHTDRDGIVAVKDFSIKKRGATTDLPAKLLTNATDANTPKANAALIPLSVLDAATTYDVVFNGWVDGRAVSKTWSFTTK